jgi:hypothetical protein
MGDLPEAIGIEKIFGSESAWESLEGLKNLKFEDTPPERLNKDLSRRILVNTLKGNIGHPLLSSGSQEVALTLKTMVEVRYAYLLTFIGHHNSYSSLGNSMH